MSGIRKSISELVGNTPLLELTNYEKNNNLEAQIIVKLEYFNPTLSIKDRIVLAMIEEAENAGKLKKGYTIVETTSGNTGNSVAGIGAAKGYKVRIYMQDGVSFERTKAVKAFGADVINFLEVPELAQVLKETNGDFFAVKRALEEILKNEEGIFFT